jgi:TPR repeat protein
MRILPTSLLAGMILLAVPGATWAGWEEGHAAFARRDYSSALREWMPLAESGHVEAQLNIAFMYNQGLGVPVDHGVARRWYHRAAEQGLAEAQAQLGVVYSQGLGVAPNYDEAVKWSTKAAEQGHPQGQFNLGAFYATGLGVPRDYKRAAFWTRKAAEQGDAASQVNLAMLYSEGLGVPRNDVEALMWLLLAPLQLADPAIAMPARGAPDIAAGARAARDALTSRMSPAQIAEAHRRAREWKPKSGPK